MRRDGRPATRECAFVTARSLAAVALTAVGFAGCESRDKSKPSERAVPERLAATISAPAAPAPAPAEHPDDGDEHAAHPVRPPPPAVTATALDAEARGRVTTLRVFAHEGAVIVRREGSRWVTANGCEVPPSRIARAFDNLSHLKAERTDDRPSGEFDLQLVVLAGEQRLLHFDIASRNERGDLVQMNDDSTFRVRGLDRALWSAQPAAWCAGP